MVQEKNTVLNIANQFIEALKRAGLKVLGAYLYGSYADGRDHPDSDIDIAVVSNDFSGDGLADWDLVCKIRRGIDVRIEAIPFRPERFCDENPLVWEIKKNGIKIA
jgi:predicted nucleotidyltransferase